MTKVEWEQIEKSLQSPWGQVELICDGYKLTLQVHRDKMRLVIMTYINGHFKGIWMSEDCEERRRFLRPKVSKVYKDSFFKGFTKKEQKYLKAKYDESITTYLPYWGSFRPLKAHLIKNNTSIELAPEA
jgi:hypothetical protein